MYGSLAARHGARRGREKRRPVVVVTWLLLVENWRSWTGAGVVRSFGDTVSLDAIVPEFGFHAELGRRRSTQPRPTRKCFLGQDLLEVRTMEMQGARWPKIVEHPWFGLNDLVSNVSQLLLVLH